jgi:hypothetical protein
MKLLRFKKVYIFFSSAFIFLLHLPFVFAKAKTVEFRVPPQNIQPATVGNKIISAVNETSIYDSLRLSSMGLARQVFDYAINGLAYMKEIGKIANDNILSIADFSKPSSQKRLFVIDIKHCKILFNTYVAHGMNSGREYANQFSNIPESNQSSPGFYETADTYNGKNGYSLHLQGIEKGINDNAYMRDIVMHGAPYVNEDMIRSQGYIGRSWGCPAVPEKLHKPIIDKIKNGTCLFIYSPNKKYIAQSKVLKRMNYSSELAYKN